VTFELGFLRRREQHAEHRRVDERTLREIDEEVSVSCSIASRTSSLVAISCSPQSRTRAAKSGSLEGRNSTPTFGSAASPMPYRRASVLLR
jgi:hypothetical protein